jgi:hypothetical protein
MGIVLTTIQYHETIERAIRAGNPSETQPHKRAAELIELAAAEVAKTGGSLEQILDGLSSVFLACRTDASIAPRAQVARFGL